MELKLDMHIHSVRSPDGCMPLSSITARARAAGLNGVAICDHDLALEDAPVSPDFLIIPGIEVSTQYGHLLGLFVTKAVDTHDFFKAAEQIHVQGGLAVLAHPFEHSRDTERLNALIPHLDGVEVWNSRAERKILRANAMAEDFARKNGLRTFAGSDAHMPQEIGNGVMAVEAEALTLEAVRAALLRGTIRVSGRRSRAWYTAKSQLNKRRRTHARPLAYLKWCAFAAKCIIKDLITWFKNINKGHQGENICR